MHRIEFLDLAAFVRVAESQSFQEAAQALHLSQPALSRRLQKLEETLGAKLLERTTRRTWLTEVGKDYLPARGECWRTTSRRCRASAS